MNKNKAVVTGACGFVGAHMCRLLKKEKWEVVGLDLPSAEREKIEGIVDTFYEADLTKKETLHKPLQGAKIVFHPAAAFSYSAPWELLKKVNVKGTQNLCEALLENGVKRLINWSTAGVYGYQDPAFQPYQEDGPKNPSNLYEKSKLAQEKVVTRFTKKGLKWTTIRPAPIYGPGNIYGVAQILLGLAKSPILAVPKNFQYKMPFIHVVDVARAALFLSQTKKSIGQTYNVVDDSTHTTYDLVQFLGKQLHKPVLPLPYTDPEVLKKIGELVAAPVTAISKGVAQLRHQKPTLLLEKETFVYLGQSFWFSGEKLKKLGFTLTYPDAFEGMKKTICWYQKEKLI